MSLRQLRRWLHDPDRRKRLLNKFRQQGAICTHPLMHCYLRLVADILSRRLVADTLNVTVQFICDIFNAIAQLCVLIQSCWYRLSALGNAIKD